MNTMAQNAAVVHRHGRSLAGNQSASSAFGVV
jgi:hypothetical protein